MRGDRSAASHEIGLVGKTHHSVPVRAAGRPAATHHPCAGAGSLLPGSGSGRLCIRGATETGRCGFAARDICTHTAHVDGSGRRSICVHEGVHLSDRWCIECSQGFRRASHSIAVQCAPCHHPGRRDCGSDKHDPCDQPRERPCNDLELGIHQCSPYSSPDGRATSSVVREGLSA